MQPLRNCNGPTIRIGREILCLPYAGFFLTLALLSYICTFLWLIDLAPFAAHSQRYSSQLEPFSTKPTICKNSE